MLMESETRVSPVDTSADGPSSIPPAPPVQTDRLYVLDLLRFLAAFAVLAHHLIGGSRAAWGAAPLMLFPEFSVTMARYGFLGVDLFFLISGFVICLSSWGRPVTEFFISRVTRLYPAYWFAVLLTSAVLVLRGAPQAPPLDQMLGNLTMAQSLLRIQHIDPVYWTLVVELKFYLVFAVVTAFGLTARRVVLFCVSWLVLALLAYASNTQFLISLLEPRYAAYFVAGVTLYLIYRFGPNPLLFGLVGAAWVLCATHLPYRINQQVTLHGPGVVSYPWALVVMTAAFLVMTAVALRKLSWLRWWGLATIGALTYPLYLLHYPLGKAAITLLRPIGPAWVVLGLVTCGLLAVAWGVHRLVERPFSRLMKRGLRSGFAQLRAASGV